MEGVLEGVGGGVLTRWPKRHWPICAHDRLNAELTGEPINHAVLDKVCIRNQV